MGLPRAFVVAVATLAAAAPLVPAGASATALAVPSGYQISVSLSAPTMTYGELSAQVHASLTVPAADSTHVDDMHFYALVDGQHFTGSVSLVSGTTWSLYVASVSNTGAGSAPLSVGQHSVVAQFASTSNGLVTSDPVTLTVLRTTPVLMCGVNYAPTYAPGAQLTVTATFSNVNTPVDPTSGTFAITFSGSQTFTVSGLAANAAGQMSVAAPSAPDVYTPTCSFSGTSTVGPVSARMFQIIVGANRAIGGIQLRTDPAPVRDGVTITWNVVVLPGPGLPAPTGYVNLRIGASTTPIVALGGGGSVTFQTNPTAPATIGQNPITVWYHGDPVYAIASADFSPNTLPIAGAAPPASATSPPGASAGAAGQAAPSDAAPADSPSAAMSTESQAADGGAAGPSATAPSVPPRPAPAQGLVAHVATGRAWAGVIVLVLLLGFGVGLAARLRRRAPAASEPTETR